MADNPQYTASPRLEVSKLSVANTALDGTGTLVSAFAAGATKGSRIDMLTLKALGTTTAGMIRLFVDNGTGAQLIYEIQVVASTPGGSAPAFSYRMLPTDTDSILPLVLPVGSTLKASTQNAEAINIAVMGGDF